MAKRSTGLASKRPRTKRGPKRLATKKRMLELKAMKPAARRKALAGK